MRKIHLFDIPLYHPDGFKHVGDRKIRLYDPVDAVIAASDVAAPAAAATVVDAGATAAATGGIDLGGGIGISADGSIVGGTAGAVGDTASLDTMLGQTAAGTGTAANTVDGFTTSANQITPLNATPTTPTVSSFQATPWNTSSGIQGLGGLTSTSAAGMFDPLAYQTSAQIASGVAQGSSVFTPTAADLVEGAAPTFTGGNAALSSQIVPSATDVVSTINNFDGTATQTLRDGTTQLVDSSLASSPAVNTPTSNIDIGNIAKNQAINYALKKILQPFPEPTKTASGNTAAPIAPSNNNPIYNTASAPLSITPLFTGSPSSGSGTFLSPLSATGLSATQLNSLYTPSGIGETTTPNLITASAQPSGGIFPLQQRYYKDGGSTHEHKPEFMTGVTGHYAQGRGTGQSDDIPAVLKDGDYVMDADIVAALGDGSNKAGAEALHHFMNQFPHKHYENHSEGGHINAMIADGEFVFPASLVTALGGGSNKEGAKKLDEMREKIREHKRSASANKIPPKAKSPLSYMEGK